MMLVNANALVVIASCALAAHAQSTTGTAPASQTSLPAGLDSCILGCVTTAASENGCGSYTNLTCTCTSTAFQEAAAQCLTNSCNSTDLTTAAALQQQECASLNSSGSSSAPASTGAPATSSSSPSATHTGAAMGLAAPFSLGGLVGTLVASAGALVGAALIL